MQKCSEDLFLLAIFFITINVLCIIPICYSCAWAGGADKVSSVSTHEVSYTVAYGRGNISKGTYRPVLMTVRLGYDLKHLVPCLTDHDGTISVYIEPQINLAFSPETDIEFGIGFGIKYLHFWSEWMVGYVFGSVGPHYISVVTDDQANGFIFSDTIGIGLAWFLKDRSAINIEYRLRHMSNAGLAEPNEGIDTHFVAIGYYIFF